MDQLFAPFTMDSATATAAQGGTLGGSSCRIAIASSATVAATLAETTSVDNDTVDQEAHRDPASRRAFSFLRRRRGGGRYEIQYAPYSKRLYAFLADVILVGLLVSAFYLALSAIFDIDGYKARYTELIAQYEAQYDVTFGLSEAEYNDLTPEQQANYKQAVDAVNADKEVNDVVRKGYTLVFVTIVVGILVAMLLLEFVVPLLLKDGRTLGKRLFGLGVMRTDSTKLSPFVLLVRNVVGKGIFELVLPVVVVLTIVLGITGVFGIVLLAVWAVAELVVFLRTGHALLHDILADTVVVDWDSQRIFDTAQARDEFYEQRRREQEANETY